MARQRSRSAALSSQSLRAGSVRVAVGLGFYGVCTYLFLAVAARVLGTDRYADFAVFWGIVYGVGLGVFLPFEQEVSRRVSESRARGGSGDAVLRTAYKLGALVVAALALVLVVAVPVFSAGTAGHSAGLWAACVAAFAGLGAAYVSRGGLSGSRRFGAYSAQLGIEGAARVVACGALAVVAARSPWPWAFVVAVALLVAVAATARSPWRGHVAEPGVRSRDLATSLSAVVVCTVIAQSLVNFGPVVVRLLSGPSEQGLAGRFMAAALVARLPVFLFAAVQAVLVPHLVEAVVGGDRGRFVTSLRQVLLPTVGLGLLGVAGCAVAGPQVLRLLIGPDFVLPRRDIVLLAVSIALFLGTLVLQPAAISLRQHRPAAIAWVIAGVVFAGGCLLPFSALLAVEMALIASCGAAVAGLATVVWRGLPQLRLP